MKIAFLILTASTLMLEAAARNNSVLSSAIQSYKKGQYSQAILKLEKCLLKKCIDKNRGAYYLALTHYKNGDSISALSVLEEIDEETLSKKIKNKISLLKLKIANSKNWDQKKLALLQKNAIKLFFQKKYSSAIQTFEKLELISPAEINKFWLGLVYLKLGSLEVSDLYFSKIKDPELKKEIATAIGSRPTIWTPKKALSFQFGYSYGSNSNPVYDSEISTSAGIQDPDTETIFTLGAGLYLFQNSWFESKLSVDYESESYADNSSSNSTSTSLSLRNSFNISKTVELSITPIASKETQDDIEILQSNGLFLDLSKQLSSDGVISIGVGKTLYSPQNTDYNFLDGASQSISFGYGHYFKNSYLGVSILRSNNALSDTSDSTVSNNSISTSLSYLHLNGRFRWFYSLNYKNKKYISDSSGFERRDETTTLKIKPSYQISKQWDIYFQAVQTNNRSNLNSDSSDPSYQQTRAVFGLNFNY